MTLEVQDDLEKTIQKLIIGFGKTNPLIYAVFKGINPEKESDVPYYYFITKSQFNEKLSDAISDLDLFIANTTGYKCELLEWPIPVSEISNYPFLQNKLWARQ